MGSEFSALLRRLLSASSAMPGGTFFLVFTDEARLRTEEPPVLFGPGSFGFSLTATAPRAHMSRGTATGSWSTSQLFCGVERRQPPMARSIRGSTVVQEPRGLEPKGQRWSRIVHKRVQGKKSMQPEKVKCGQERCSVQGIRRSRSLGGRGNTGGARPGGMQRGSAADAPHTS